MLNVEAQHKTEGGSDRNFGLVFASVFTIVAFWPLTGDGGVRIWALAVAGPFLVIALLRPSILSAPNRIWTKFGLLLGAIVAPIVMALVFFLTVTPTGLVMRALGKDLLRQRIDKNARSYWIEREEPAGSMKYQF